MDWIEGQVLRTNMRKAVDDASEEEKAKIKIFVNEYCDVLKKKDVELLKMFFKNYNYPFTTEDEQNYNENKDIINLESVENFF